MISFIGTLHFRHVTGTPASHRSPLLRAVRLDSSKPRCFRSLNPSVNGTSVPPHLFSWLRVANYRMTMVRRQIAPPAERYPAISVAALPTRWSADADPLPHLRIGPRIQTPWTPVLFAPACQSTIRRFHGQWCSFRVPRDMTGALIGAPRSSVNTGRLLAGKGFAWSVFVSFLGRQPATTHPSSEVGPAACTTAFLRD